MMAGDALYPCGFHPSQQRLLFNAKDYAKHLRRRDVGYVKYYITDFGISLHYEDPEIPRIAFGLSGQDQEVPELIKGDPYDPFKKDIFTLGHLFKETFLDVSETCTIKALGSGLTSFLRRNTPT